MSCPLCPPGKEFHMKICKCDSCRYTFRYPILPAFCPDCGKQDVRPADKMEIKTYWCDQAMLAEEIRAGLYAASPI